MSTKVTVGESWEAVLIPEDVYEAELVSITAKTIDSDDEKREVFEWNYKIVEGEYKDTEINALSSQTFTTKSKAFQWYKAMTGNEPHVNDEIDLDDLIGSPVRITVKTDVKKVLGEKQDVSVVKDVMKTGRKAAGKTSAK